MNIKRAIGMSVLAYISSLIIGVLVAVALNIDLAETQEIPPEMWYAGAIASILFAALFAWLYFRSPKITPNAKAGLQFGIVMVATGFALDFITLLPLMTHENPYEPIMEYYLNPLFWATILLVVVTTTLTGKLLTKKSN